MNKIDSSTKENKSVGDHNEVIDFSNYLRRFDAMVGVRREIGEIGISNLFGEELTDSLLEHKRM